MTRLLWPDLEAEDVAAGWVVESPALSASQVLDALAHRHPMDGWNGVPGRWVFTREVVATTGVYGDAQRFDAVAVGLVPSNRYARVVYEVKVSRADWLRELRVRHEVRDELGRIAGRRAEAVARNIGQMPGTYTVTEVRKWDAALAVSTEFWIAAPPRCVLVEELPPEAGLLEVRLWGSKQEPRARIVRKAPVRQTPNPGPGFWASVLRRAAARAE